MSYLRLKLKLNALVMETGFAKHTIDQHTMVYRELLVRDRLAKGGLTDKQISRIIKRAKGRNLFIKTNKLTKVTECLLESEAFLKANVAKGSPEAKWIRAKQFDIDAVRHHRKLILRPEIRASHLAMTFLRGKPYAYAENYGFSNKERRNTPNVGRYTSLNWGKIQSIAGRFSEMPRADLAVAFDKWKTEAKAFRIERGVDASQSE